MFAIAVKGIFDELASQIKTGSQVFMELDHQSREAEIRSGKSRFAYEAVANRIADGEMLRCEDAGRTHSRLHV
jgi:hypothetical protein